MLVWVVATFMFRHKWFCTAMIERLMDLMCYFDKYYSKGSNTHIFDKNIEKIV